MQFTSFDTYGMAYSGYDYVRFNAHLMSPYFIADGRTLSEEEASTVDANVTALFTESVLAASDAGVVGADGQTRASVPKFEDVFIDIDVGLLPSSAQQEHQEHQQPPLNFTSSYVDTMALYLANVTTVKRQQMYDYMVTRSHAGAPMVGPPRLESGMIFHTLLPETSALHDNATTTSQGEVSEAAAAIGLPFFIEDGAVTRGYYVNASFVRPAEALGTVALPPLEYADLNTIYTGINYDTTTYGPFITDTIYQQLGNTVMTRQQLERREIIIQMVVQLRFGLPIKYTTASMQAGLWTKQYIADLFNIPIEKIQVMLPSSSSSSSSSSSRPSSRRRTNGLMTGVHDTIEDDDGNGNEVGHHRVHHQQHRVLMSATSEATSSGLENGTVVLSLSDDVNAQVEIATKLVEEHQVADRSIRGSIGVIVGRGPGSNLIVDRTQVADISSAAVVGIMRNVAMINMTDPRAQTVTGGGNGNGDGSGDGDGGAGDGSVLGNAISVRYRSLYVMSRPSLQYMLETETAMASIIGVTAMLITGVLLWGCCFQMPKAKVKKRKRVKGDLFGDFGSADYDGDDEYLEDDEGGGGGFGFGLGGDATTASAYFGQDLNSDAFMSGLSMGNGDDFSYSNPLAIQPSAANNVSGVSSDDYYGSSMAL